MLKFKERRTSEGHKGLIGLVSSAEQGSKPKAVANGCVIVQMPERCKVGRPFEGLGVCAVSLRSTLQGSGQLKFMVARASVNQLNPT